VQGVTLRVSFALQLMGAPRAKLLASERRDLRRGERENRLKNAVLEGAPRACELDPADQRA
jgi:hypothetical protein